ncbi:hypothetical protein HU200_002203 [Digitaria exilis]|uniref:Protein kinase domain-containing protein n=1 Tax=Digitaria exilis TaxID=1010633 RepID=A0A835KX31_9POAL|nr:hypothetical protein HU200_002203 [Digitaria exilis]
MQSRHQSGRPPRLTRRNAIRQSAYVPGLSPPPDQTDAAGSIGAYGSDLEEGDALGAAEEIGEMVETGDETAWSEPSDSSVLTVVKRRISNWRKLDLVGAGSFGRVYKAVSEEVYSCISNDKISYEYRDIKCANILLDLNGTVKVGDFGLAKQVIRGTPYGRSADIWSLGCTVLEMFIQRPPYPDENWVSAFYQIGRGQLPPVPSSLPPVAREFIQECLRVNPDDRPSADQLLEHPFVAPPDQAQRVA